MDLLRKFKTMNGCSLNRVVKSGKDYLFTDESSIQECEVSFEKKSFDTPPTSLLEIVESCQLYEKVTIVVKILTLGEILETSDALKYQECTVVDSSDEQRSLTFYHDLCNKIVLNENYNITHVNIAKFNGRKVLKTTERSVITKVANSAVTMKKSSSIKERGIITSFDMSSLMKLSSCPKCHEEVDDDDELVMCLSCNTVTSATYANSASSARFVVKTNTGTVNLSATIAQMEDLATIPSSN